MIVSAPAGAREGLRPGSAVDRRLEADVGDQVAVARDRPRRRPRDREGRVREGAAARARGCRSRRRRRRRCPVSDPLGLEYKGVLVPGCAFELLDPRRRRRRRPMPLPDPVTDHTTSSGGPRIVSTPPWPANRIGSSRVLGSEVISSRSLPLPPWIVRPLTVEIERDSVRPFSVSPMRPSAKVSSSRLSASLRRTSHASGAAAGAATPTAGSPPSRGASVPAISGADVGGALVEPGRAPEPVQDRGEEIHPAGVDRRALDVPAPAGGVRVDRDHPAVALRERGTGEVGDRERDPVRRGRVAGACSRGPELRRLLRHRGQRRSVDRAGAAGRDRRAVGIQGGLLQAGEADDDAVDRDGARALARGRRLRARVRAREEEPVVATGPAVDDAADGAALLEDERVLVVGGPLQVLDARERDAGDRAGVLAVDRPGRVRRRALDPVDAVAAVEGDGALDEPRGRVDPQAVAAAAALDLDPAELGELPVGEETVDGDRGLALRGGELDRVVELGRERDDPGLDLGLVGRGGVACRRRDRLGRLLRPPATSVAGDGRLVGRRRRCLRRFGACLGCRGCRLGGALRLGRRGLLGGGRRDRLGVVEEAAGRLLVGGRVRRGRGRPGPPRSPPAPAPPRPEPTRQRVQPSPGRGRLPGARG